MKIEKKINCRGISINFIDEGRGDAIIFIHNGGGFWQIWEKQIDHFSKNYRVIAIDLPGFGNSSEAKELYTLDFNSQIILDIVDKLKIDNTKIVGNCIGASIAINLKNKYPQRFKKIILMNICPGERLIRSRLMRQILFNTKSDKIKSMLKLLLSFIMTKTPLKKKN